MATILSPNYPRLSRYGRLPSGVSPANCVSWPFQMAILVQQLGPHLHPPLSISHILISTSRSGVGRIISYPTNGSVTVDLYLLHQGLRKGRAFFRRFSFL
jgi:hypothetical protein